MTFNRQGQTPVWFASKYTSSPKGHAVVPPCRQAD